MRLILSGGPRGERAKESYNLFAKSVGDKKVMYIPLAWEKYSYEKCLTDYFLLLIEPYGILDVDLITDANQITCEKLKQVGGVYFGGGNVFKLLKLLKESCAYKNLKDFALKNDTVVMGGSAGALIWGKSIETCKDDGLGLQSICDENNVGLIDCSGFDMLKGFSLLVHYKKLPEQNDLTEKRIQRLINESYKLICLPEEASIVVEDDKIYSIGAEIEIITKSRREKIKPKQAINLQDNLV